MIMYTNLSDHLIEVSSGYTFAKASNLPCNIRMFVRVLRRLGGYTRIECRFPRNGVFTINTVWHNNRAIRGCDCITIDEHCQVELINNGICFYGHVPSMCGSEFNKYVNRLLSTVEFTIGINGKYTAKPLMLVSFRDYDFKYGKKCTVCGVRSSFTLSDLQREAELPRAFTNISIILPGDFEDYWNDFDDFYVQITSGSLYAFTFETE